MADYVLGHKQRGIIDRYKGDILVTCAQPLIDAIGVEYFGGQRQNRCRRDGAYPRRLRSRIMEIASLIASIVSIIITILLGVLAIWLSLYFYKQTKNTETAVEKSLTRIETQTEALQKLTAKWMDRYTKFFTTPKEPDPAHLASLDAIRQIQISIASQLPNNQAMEAMGNEILTAYIAIYFYAGVANVASQGYLPKPEDLEPDNLPKFLVDKSKQDFDMIEGILENVDPARLRANSLNFLLTAALTQWKPQVKDAATLYAEAAAAEVGAEEDKEEESGHSTL